MIRAQRWGALIWLVQPVYVVIELIVATAASGRVVVSATDVRTVVSNSFVPSQPIQRPAYSLLDETISALGSAPRGWTAYVGQYIPGPSPLHGVLNASFIVFGALLAAGALLLRPRLPAGPLTTASSGLWVVAGASSIATGLVPLSVDPELHAWVSLPVLVAQPLALMLLGLTLRDRTGWLTALIGVVSLLGALVFLARPADAALAGFFERLALWPGYLWLPVVVIALLRARPDGGAAPAVH